MMSPQGDPQTAIPSPELVKNGSVISVSDGPFSSDVIVVINSFLQFQQCQRSWISRVLTRSSHSRLTNPEPHRGHVS